MHIFSSHWSDLRDDSKFFVQQSSTVDRLNARVWVSVEMNAENQRKLHKSKGNILWQLTTDKSNSPYFAVFCPPHSQFSMVICTKNERRKNINRCFSRAVAVLPIPSHCSLSHSHQLNRWKIHENVIKSFRSFITCAHQERLPYFISSPFLSPQIIVLVLDYTYFFFH